MNKVSINDLSIKEIIEFIIYEQLQVIQKYQTSNRNIQLHLDTYNQILNVFRSTNEDVRNLIDELSRIQYPIKSTSTNNENITPSLTRCKTEKVETIITELVMKIQSNPSLKKSISFHTKVYRQILDAVYSTNKELMTKLGQLEYESFKTNLDDLHINNHQ